MEKKKVGTVCLMCRTQIKGRETSTDDHFCNGKVSPHYGKPVTIWSSCSYQALLGNKLTFRMKLAMLAQGLANKLSEVN